MKRKTTLRVNTAVKLRQRILLKASAFTLAIGAFAALIVIQTFDSKKSSAQNGNDALTIQSLSFSSVCSENPSVQRRWKVTNPNTFPVTYVWDVFPMIQSGTNIAPPGESYFFTNTVNGSNQVRLRWLNENNRWRQVMQNSTNMPCVTGNIFASEVINYSPKKRNDGSFIPENFQISLKALGEPQNDNTENFVALGFGGEITLKFQSPVANGNGADIKVFETTFNNSNCQRQPKFVYVFASFDGCNYVYCGKGCQDFEFDLGPLSQAQYIKLVDCSNPSSNFENQVSDAYRVDAIQSLNGVATNIIEDNLSYGSATDIISFSQGRRKSGQAVHVSRSNPQVALGVPEDDDIGSTNFVALGFNGSITLKFDYVIFNKEGNDLLIIETSFGAPGCSNYPERVQAEISLDGQTWYDAGFVCLDGELDLGALPAIQYIRLNEKSAAGLFPSSADGFDLDGILALHHCQGQARIGYFDNNSVPDEIAEISVFPNPSRENFNISYETGTSKEQVNFKIFSLTGQLVWQNSYELMPNSKEQIEINSESFSKGTYVLVAESGVIKQTLKLVKQ